MPTTNDDAQRQQLVASIFYTMADLVAGTDTAYRVDPNYTRTDGLLGPTGSATSYGVGNGGELYVRGYSGQAGTASTAPAASAGLTITPGLLLLLGLVWFVAKH